MPTSRCHIALGGNTGDVPRTFRQAMAELNADPLTNVIGISEFHRTAPMGANAGEGFWNAAAELETRHPPIELLDLLQRVETNRGRERDVRWGPRPLDLDLILFGDECVRLPRLTVPHRDYWYRRFVLDPLVEIAPDVVDPLSGLTVTQLRDRLLERPLTLRLLGKSASASADLLRDFPKVKFISSNDESAAITVRLGEDAISEDCGTMVDATTRHVAPHEFLRDILTAAIG